MGDVSPNFSRAEFACKCGCGADAVDPILVMNLERMRAEAGGPIVIISACRCENHNREEGGKADSAHLCVPEKKEWCQAVDIVAATGRDLFRLLHAAISAGFTRIGIGKDFLHVDIDPLKPQEVVWLYPGGENG